MQLEPGVGRVKPPDNTLQPEQLGVGDERQADIVRRCLRLHA